jgi:small conductance mechanosensitive channel
MLQGAFTGDPAMVRDFMTVAGTFAVRLLVSAIILVVTVWAAKHLARAASRAVGRMNAHHHGDATLETFVGSLVRYFVVVIGLIAVLQQLGVQATSVIAVLGAASLAIGLALQGALGNVAAGVMLLLLRPYRVGDKVELNGRQGTVADLDLFNTKLTDFDGLTLYLPNGKVFGDMIVNISRGGSRRVDLTFGVDYDDDLDLALDVLKEVALADVRVQTDPPPWSKVTGLADSSVNVTLRCWTASGDWLDTKFDLTKAIKEEFQRRGLHFPYPHQVEIGRTPINEPPSPRDVAA